jgi:hypothetical protein
MKSQLQALRQDVRLLQRASNTPKIHGHVSLELLSDSYYTSSLDFHLGGMQLQLSGELRSDRGESDKLWIGWYVIQGASCKITADITVVSGGVTKYGPKERTYELPHEESWNWGHNYNELTVQKLRDWGDVTIMAKIELSF